jgi:antitoxin (DNA-binding transcriptional repressor) of toxin-antitoxin stability system
MRVSATEASRGFSDLLSRVAGGETVEIDRHGQVVAVIRPPAPSLISGAALLQLIDRLPAPDGGFGRDVAALRDVTGDTSDPWPS